jgi:soluble lytic murein transglycosylase
MTKDTFDWIKPRIAPDDALTFDDLYDPGQSVRFGGYYLSICLRRYSGDVSTAAAAYHSGWGTVDRLLAGGDYGTRERVLDEFPYRQMAYYVYKINSSYHKYRQIYGE